MCRMIEDAESVWMALGAWRRGLGRAGRTSLSVQSPFDPKGGQFPEKVLTSSAGSKFDVDFSPAVHDLSSFAATVEDSVRSQA